MKELPGAGKGSVTNGAVSGMAPSPPNAKELFCSSYLPSRLHVNAGLLLRFILAAFWIAHWYRGMPTTKGFFLQQGLLAWPAWFDISFEVVTAVRLVLGIFLPL